MALYKDYNIGGHIVTLNMDHVDVAIQTDDSITTIKGDAVNQVKFTKDDVQLRASDKNKDGQKEYTLSLISDWEGLCANQPPKTKDIIVKLNGDDTFHDMAEGIIRQIYQNADAKVTIVRAGVEAVKEASTNPPQPD